jgi:hypothetical protein
LHRRALSTVQSPVKYLFSAPLLALLFACSSSTSNSAPGSVAENGDCNADSECATVAGKELACLCAPNGGSHAQCTALVAEGASCAATSAFQVPCDSGTYCSGDSSASAKCVRYAARGESCTARKCAAGLACGDDKTCGDPRPVGSKCVSDNDCALDTVCGSSFKCAAPAAIGESCFGFTPSPDDKSGRRNPCVAGAGCLGGKCATLKADGAACDFSDECASALCMHTSAAAGTCSAASGDTHTVKLCAR